MNNYYVVNISPLYIFLIRITSRVDLVVSVCLSVRMNAEISETVKARKLGFG